MPETDRFADQDGRWALLDAAGQPLGPSFDGFQPFAEGRAWVNLGGARAFRPKDWHYPWRAGAALGGAWGLIDEAGAWLVPPRYAGASAFREGRSWANQGGQARATEGWVTYWIEGGRWALLDRDGRELAPPRFDRAKGFVEGLAWASEGGRWGLLDREAAWRIPPRFEEPPPDAGERPAFAAGAEPAAEGGRWGLIDPAGAWVLPPSYDTIWGFREGFARVANWLDEGDPQDQVARTGRFGFVDPRGRLLHPVTLERAADFHGGRARVTAGGRSAWLDPSGQLSFGPTSPSSRG